MKRAMRPYKNKVEFITAQTAIEAMVAIGAERPDLLVLDSHIPNLDVFELIAQLKGRPETRSIDVVLLVERLTPAFERRAMARGAKATLQKPLSAIDLLAPSSIQGVPAPA